MQALTQYLNSIHSIAQIDFQDNKWHVKAGIPDEPGWYFIRTNTPVSVLSTQQLWQQTYHQPKNNRPAPVKNYCIAERASRYNAAHPRFWNVQEVYSGLASSLRDRAREHTFGDPGTYGLALYRYPILSNYSWSFGFISLRRYLLESNSDEVALKLGEQIWRSNNGWPLLCVK